MNISNNNGRLLMINCSLLIILFFYGVCYILPQDLFFKETVTGLQYKKISSSILEEKYDYSGEEKGFFLIERKVTYGKYCLEHPSQFFYIDNHYPYAVDMEEIKNNHVWNRYFELLFIIPIGCEYEARIPICDIYPIAKIKSLKLDIDSDISIDSIVTMNVKKIKYYSEKDIDQLIIDNTERIEKLKQKHLDVLSNKIEKDLYINGIKYVSKKKKNGYLVCVKENGTGEKINKGDEIFLQYKYYKHYRDSKVYSTNIEDVAQKNGIYDANVSYKPYKIYVGEPTIPCLDVIFIDENLDLCSGASIVVYDFSHSQFFGDMDNIVVVHCDIYKNSKLESNSDTDSDNISNNSVQNEQQNNEGLNENEKYDDNIYVEDKQEENKLGEESKEEYKKEEEKQIEENTEEEKKEENKQVEENTEEEKKEENKQVEENTKEEKKEVLVVNKIGKDNVLS